MENELEGLADVLRRDVALLDADAIPHSTSWHRVRAELIRLARENAELRDTLAAKTMHVTIPTIAMEAEFANYARPFKLRAERAESELAALRNRVGESPCVMEWRGDMEDDCTLERYGMNAHAECLGRNTWWFAVGRGDFPNYVELYNTANNETSIRLTTGKMARAAAECVMEALRGKA